MEKSYAHNGTPVNIMRQVVHADISRGDSQNDKFSRVGPRVHCPKTVGGERDDYIKLELAACPVRSFPVHISGIFATLLMMGDPAIPHTVLNTKFSCLRVSKERGSIPGYYNGGKILRKSAWNLKDVWKE